MKYMNLDQKGAVLAEYVWIDGSNGLRSKTKVSYDIFFTSIRWDFQRCESFDRLPILTPGPGGGARSLSGL